MWVQIEPLTFDIVTKMCQVEHKPKELSSVFKIRIFIQL